MNNGQHDRWLRQIGFDGFCILDRVVPETQCVQIGEHLITAAQRHRVATAYATGKVSFVPGLINYDQSFAAYLADSRVLALAEAMLGPHVRISYTSATLNEPGKARSKWHADWPFNQNGACHIPAPYPDRIMHLTALLMISPFSEENGGTLFVPGSHRNPTNPTDKRLDVDPNSAYPSELRITAPAGSMVLFDSRLWHCSPANPSDTVRMAIALRYAPWWLNLESLDPDSPLRQQVTAQGARSENVQPRIPPAIYQSLPEVAKPLYRHWVALS